MVKVELENEVESDHDQRKPVLHLVFAVLVVIGHEKLLMGTAVVVV